MILNRDFKVMSLFDVEHFRNDNKIDAWLQLTSDTHSNMWPVELWHYRWPRWTFKVILAILSVKKVWPRASTSD